MDRRNSMKFIHINTQEDLNYLVNSVKNGQSFAEPFKFKTDKLKDQFFSSLNISIDDFIQKYFFCDYKRRLHISESSLGYIWISTIGLVAQRGSFETNNKYYNAFISQYRTLSLLVDKAINICEDEGVYDIDGYSYGYLNDITPSLFHNFIFYFEIFGKTYLFFNNIQPDKLHNLSEILQEVKKCMFKHNQNDTLFHTVILSAFEDIVKYINIIPGNFKEQYVKYDDNSGDFTVIRFDRSEFISMKNTIELSYDFISDFYYNRTSKDVLCLNQGIYNKMLELANTDEEKQRVTNKYGYLLDRE